MFVLGPTDNGNTTNVGPTAPGAGDKKVTVDDRFGSKDGNFGGNRAVSSTPAKDGDYKRPTLGAPNRKENPVDETERDIDDLAGTVDDKYRGDGMYDRQQDASDLTQRFDLQYVKTDAENRPPEDTDAFTPDPDDPDFLIKKRRSKNKGQYGDGQYDNYPNRGYEGELR
jgi:hypothetical protein